MRSTTLFEAIGDIDDKKIADAISTAPVRRNYGWMKITCLAACCALVVGVAFYGSLLKNEKPSVSSEPVTATKYESSAEKKVSGEKAELIKMRNKLFAAKKDGELPSVKSIEFDEESGKIRVVVAGKSEEDIKKLSSYDSEGRIIDIDFE